jgi:GT2 family glycosyltransferase
VTWPRTSRHASKFADPIARIVGHEGGELGGVGSGKLPAWVCAAVFLVRKESFDRLGGFDENFFLYKEEEDLCLRLLAEGGRVIYDPSIAVLHHGGVVAKKSQYMRASADYFLKKHFHGRIGYPVFWVISKLISYDDGY